VRRLPISSNPLIPLMSLISLVLLAPPFGAARADAAVTALVAGNQLVVGGDGAANQITLRLFALDSGKIQVLDGSILIGTFERATFTSIVINAVGGNDTVVFRPTFGPITEPAEINGGLGDDTVSGGAGNDVLRGGDDHDRIIWNPGDGSDLIEGGNGQDVVEANGSASADTFDAAPSPSLTRVGLLRSVDAAAVDIGTTETLEMNLLAGNDFVRVSSTIPGSTGLVVNGGEGSDVVGFFGDATSETVTIAPDGGRIRVTRNPGNFQIDVDDVEHIGVEGGDGDDTVAGTDGLAATGLLSLILRGGDGNDTLTGGDTDNDELRGDAGNDQLNGGAGGDFLLAGPGLDVLNGGPGNDFLIWVDGDGDVVFDGGPGTDRLGVNGSLNTDVFNVQGSGASFTVKRNAGNINMVGHVEVLEIDTLGGDDIVSVDGALATLVSIDIDTGVGADSIDTAASAVVTVNGNSGQDTLDFDALGQPISVTSSTITVGGLTRLTHTQVEDVRFSGLLNPLPSITITSPTIDPATTASTPFIALVGRAADASGITSIAVTSDRGGSGVTVTSDLRGFGFAAGATDWTASHVPLASGANVLTATVRDTSGNQVSDTLTVTVNAFVYTLAEGSTGSFFDTAILIANPNSQAAPVTITYLKGDGATVPQALTLAPTSRTTIRVDEIAGLEGTEVSATVTSTAALPIVVERTMRWDATGYGAHTEKATDGPAKTWFFAEGSQGFFDTYVLLANPGPIANTATVTFLLENGAPVVKTFPVAPTSRLTVRANAIPEVVGQSFGIVVSFTEPGVAERAMYFGARQFDAGHESAGVNAPSTSWFLAEGATGSFFTTFVLLANPGTADASATITFLPDSGAAVTKTKPVPAGQRVTLNIAAEDASLASGAIATAVQSTQPILVERAQYWPSTPDRWYEAHNAFGSTAVGTKWGLAEGRVGGPEGYQTFILLANADPTQAAHVRITFLRVDGTTAIRTFTVNPTSRLNVQANGVSELANESFGALIEVTSGASIFVERALYSDAQGVVFAAGTNALATRLP
jgi:hypothetical protein